MHEFSNATKQHLIQMGNFALFIYKMVMKIWFAYNMVKGLHMLIFPVSLLAVYNI